MDIKAAIEEIELLLLELNKGYVTAHEALEKIQAICNLTLTQLPKEN